MTCEVVYWCKVAYILKRTHDILITFWTTPSLFPKINYVQADM